VLGEIGEKKPPRMRSLETLHPSVRRIGTTIYFKSYDVKNHSAKLKSARDKGQFDPDVVQEAIVVAFSATFPKARGLLETDVR
jgi:hypothetical protein